MKELLNMFQNRLNSSLKILIFFYYYNKHRSNLIQCERISVYVTLSSRVISYFKKKILIKIITGKTIKTKIFFQTFSGCDTYVSILKKYLSGKLINKYCII